ncbi:hypothetical protein EG240_15930 [Paenimyroides tangerinum]|uniref:Uncharacterized protein n=1 Tax=Paenimyroides tangerinum TaxID=2488728 RepID=A0A3P3VV48_9FLAO|nr:hypothetical protein [Paenimyroides tangerinum]RRJ86682.1 hypothetical protein EG240_15930 [Paenimyroides tangerinum]
MDKKIHIKTKEEIIHLLFKRGSEHRMKDFIEKGEMYFNTLEYMRAGEKDDHRQDLDEGLIKRNHLKKCKIQLFRNDKYLDNIDPEFTFNDVDVVLKDGFTNGNIYSLTGLFNKQLKSNLKIDIKEFGESLVIIKNPRVFMERVIKKLDELKLDYKYRPVQYYDDDHSGNLSTFHKRVKYKDQNEFRFFINCKNKHEPITIQIGDLRDIAVKYDNPLEMKLNLTDGRELLLNL